MVVVLHKHNVTDFRLPQRCTQDLRSSETLRRAE